MKKIVLLLVLLIITQVCRSQVPNWLWAEGTNSTISYEFMFGISVDTLTNTIFAGGRCGGANLFGGETVTAGGQQNPFLGKFDKNGNAAWLVENTFSTGFDYPWGFYRDTKDNTYSDGIVNSGQTMFAMKYNNLGVLQWADSIGNFNLSLHGIAADGAGCAYVAGVLTSGSVTLGSTTLSYSGTGSAIVVAKLDATGHFLWAKAFYGTGSDDGEDSGRGITIDSHANIFVTGGYTGSPTFGSFTAPLTTGISNLFLVKMDSSGKVLNLVNAYGAGYDNGDCCSNTGIAVDSCDDVYLTGYFEASAQFGDFVLNTNGGKDAYIAKCGGNGLWDWAQNIGGTGDDYGGGITVDKNTDVYATGSYSNGAASIEGKTVTGGDMWVTKLDNGTGLVDWLQTAGLTNNGDGTSGITVDNNFYVYIDGSYSHSATFGSTTITDASSTGTDFIAKLDTLNKINITPMPDSFYCAGKTYSLPYTILGTFTSGNIFTAQLSNDSGNFNPPVNLGSYVSTTSGTITITIPSNTPFGTHYRIRILSTKPIFNTVVPTSNCIYRPVDTTYFYIIIYPIPSLIITGNTIICAGDSTTLSTSGAQHYLWNNSDTTSSITVHPATNTNYSVILTNGPCIYKDSTTVIINPPPVITVQPANPLICAGTGLSLSATGALSYRWSPSFGLNATTGEYVFAGPTHNTTYTVTGTDSNGCVGSAKVTVDVGTEPKASFSFTAPNGCQPQQIQFTNNSSDDSIVLWHFGDGTTSNQPNPLHDFKSTGIYKITLVVTSSTGCEDSLMLSDTINQTSDFAIFPNAFTPGKENANSVFKPNILCNSVTVYLFRVYNRWGQILFESSSPGQGWDGTYDGKAQPLDVYEYYLKLSCGTCSAFKKGNVTLIR